MKRKYTTEFGIHSYVSWACILQQEQLDSISIPNDKMPQIYFIGKRIRIVCDPNSLKLDNDGLVSGIAIIQNDEKTNIPFNFKIKDIDNSFIISSDYPHSKIKLSNGSKNIEIKIANILSVQDQNNDTDYLDVEVLYIGQSFSESDEYGIIDRLKSHSTLQKIYSTIITNFPNYEIWIGLFYFEGDIITSIDGTNIDTIMTQEEDNEHIKRVLNTEISEKHIINFTEAALIRYFQPSFNKIFKDKFPSDTHSSYSDCYSLDINQISVGFATDSIKCMFYTKDIQRKIVYNIEFPLHSKEERKSMLDILFN